MLVAFSEQTKGEKLPENLSDLDLMEIVMNRYKLFSLVLVAAAWK